MTISVLLADDQHLVRAGFRMILEAQPDIRVVGEAIDGDEAVNQARDVIAAFADPANAGKGVLKVNGRMTELLHLAQAKRMVAVAEAIAAREAAS